MHYNDVIVRETFIQTDGRTDTSLCFLSLFQYQISGTFERSSLMVITPHHTLSHRT